MPCQHRDGSVSKAANGIIIQPANAGSPRNKRLGFEFKITQPLQQRPHDVPQIDENFQ